MKRSQLSTRILAAFLVLALGLQMTSPAMCAPAGGDSAAAEKPPQAAKIVKEFKSIEKSTLKVRLRASKVADATAKRFGHKLRQAEAKLAVLEDGHEIAIVPYDKADSSAVMAFGVLPSGKDFAVTIEVVRSKDATKVRYTDATGAGILLDVESKGDQFRLINPVPLDKKTGYLDRGLDLLGVGTAEAFTWSCWMKCVLQKCPTWSWCWIWSGVSCAYCLATLGAGCWACFGTLGGLAYNCASRC